MREESDTWRGHVIRHADNGWVYADTGGLVAEHVDRACGHCGGSNTPEGHDHCMETLPGVVNACCGHGRESAAYVVLEDGRRLAALEALEWAQAHGARIPTPARGG